MTLEDLMNIFERAVAKAAPFPQHHEDGIYEGIRAVVTALRDETAIKSCACKFWLDDILASDGGVKVADYVCNDVRVIITQDTAYCAKPETPAADPIRDAVAKARGRTLAVDDIPTLNKIAAAMQTPAAAPVCEWTKDVQFRDAYSTACGYVMSKRRDVCICSKTAHIKSDAAR